MKENLEKIVRKVIKRETNMEIESPDESLLQAGLNSYLITKCIVALEDEVNIEFPANMLNLDNFLTVRKMQKSIELIKQSKASETEE